MNFTYTYPSLDAPPFEQILITDTQELFVYNIKEFC